MVAATRRLVAGDFDTQVDLDTTDEAGQLARAFNGMADSLSGQERQRRAFMADISHELRTPLAVLRGELEAMEDGFRPLSVAGLQSLQSEVGALSKLIDELFELSLAEVGGPTYNHSMIDIGLLMEVAADAWATRYRQAGLTLERVPTEVPLMITRDKRRLTQLLYNLLENSLRYTRPPGIVRLVATQVEASIRIDIHDSAPGVPDADRLRLFERFYRVEGSRSRRSGGVGLGLAICRGIAEVHGGHMTAHPSPLGGLWLELFLPAYVTSDAHDS